MVFTVFEDHPFDAVDSACNRTGLLGVSGTLTRPAQPALDMHEDSSTDGDRAGWIAAAQERRKAILDAGCTRWPKSLRLVSTAGHFVPGRCGSTNACDYCGILGGVAWSEMLALDALSESPTVYVCLTTPRATRKTADFHRAREFLLRAIRARWGKQVQYVCLVEFTTGYAATSGGKRRPHWNLLLKGVPATDAAMAELRDLISLHWCTASVGAKLAGQRVQAVTAAEGLIRYLALHFLKESQKPPRGWTGHRVFASRGYFAIGQAKQRREAEGALKLKRELWKLGKQGVYGPDADALAHAARERAELTRWECIELTIDTATGEVLRGRPIHGRDTVLKPARRGFQADRAARVARELVTASGDVASPDRVNLSNPYRQGPLECGKEWLRT